VSQVATAQQNRTLLAALFVTVGMLFTAFAAAFLEQRGTGWQTIELPALVWFNTALLLLSSVTLEIGRRRGMRGWFATTMLLATGFLVGQVALWAELRGRGVYLPSGGYASFLYLLTGLHVAHLAAGMIALVYGAMKPHVMRFVAIFWHFLGVIWLYVLGVLLLI
jgi:cytochrome c oxidase subunit 3